MFFCYLDDSGTSKHEPVVTLAGFVAKESVWQSLENHYEKVLASYKVPTLHAKEFHETKGCFSGWNQIRKRSFIQEIFDSRAGKIDLGISISAVKKSYRERQEATGLNKTLSAYGVCLSAIITRLVLGTEVGKEVRGEGVSFCIEHGNANNDGLEVFFRKAQNHADLSPHIVDISFPKKTDCRAIQVADFYAYFTRRNAVQHEKSGRRLALPINRYHAYLQTVVATFERVVTDPYADISAARRSHGLK
jgi:Protein of unknown function (DUF3800)